MIEGGGRRQAGRQAADGEAGAEGEAPHAPGDVGELEEQDEEEEVGGFCLILLLGNRRAEEVECIWHFLGGLRVLGA